MPASDSPVKHAFYFTPSWSFFVSAASDDEQRRLFAERLDGVGVMMPPGDNRFSKRSTWVDDCLACPGSSNSPDAR